MAKSVIKFYVGDYVPKLGYPFVLINSQWMRRSSEHGADIYVIIQQVPEINKFNLEQMRVNAELTQATLDGWEVTNPEAFVEEEAKDWVEKTLDYRRRKAQEEKGAGVPYQAYQLREEAKWETALLRLRLRGLSDEVLQTIKHSTESQDLVNCVNTLSGIQPIVVRDGR